MPSAFFVTKNIPSYLRLHPESVSQDVRSGVATSQVRGKRSGRGAASETLDQFWRAYSEATGWRIDQRSDRSGQPMEILPATLVDGMATANDSDASPVVSRSSARRLADAAQQMAQQLRRSEDAIRRQEAELARRISGHADILDSAHAFADRIDRVLSDAVAALGFDAAAMYLLDDETTSLKTRAVFGLQPSRLTDPPRQLADCRGDLEALVRNVVLIDDLTAGPFDMWACPEDFGAAICASINANDLPIGTCWLFAHDSIALAERHAAVARLTASHLAAELRATTVNVPIDLSLRTAAVSDSESIAATTAWQDATSALIQDVMHPLSDVDDHDAGPVDEDRDFEDFLAAATRLTARDLEHVTAQSAIGRPAPTRVEVPAAPATDEPVTDEPVTDEPVTDEPVTNEAATNNPATQTEQESPQPRVIGADVAVLTPLCRWQVASLPAATNLAQGWWADGMIQSNRSWACGWHHWDILPDGSMAWMIGEATDPSLAGSMTAAFARAAAISHAGYRHQPAELLSRVGDTIWQLGIPGQTFSLLYARLDPQTGEGEIASAGGFRGLIASRHGHRPVVPAGSRPLAHDFHSLPHSAEFQLQPGEGLIAMNAHLVQVGDGDRLVRAACERIATGRRNLLAGLQAVVDGIAVTGERAAAVLTRRPTPTT